MRLMALLLGEWQNGMRNGCGTFYYASGAIYSGYWKDNKKVGLGQRNDVLTN
jgi:hypothetical protein